MLKLGKLFGYSLLGMIAILMVVSIGEDTAFGGDEISTGTTSGMMVGGPQATIGTIFVAEIPGEGGKFLCTAEHIAELANKWGIVQISSDLELSGPFTPIGYDQGAEMIYCAPVETEWPAFVFTHDPMPFGQVAEVPLVEGNFARATIREFGFATMNQTGTSGFMVTTSGWYFQPSNSGSPLTVDGFEVYGVLSGGRGDTGFFIPFDEP